ncbi:GntR family transcriptional regulator [bacterium]|nr:GntR family transcriptional regulator [bacterium]
MINNIDKNSHTPLYIQLEKALRKKISNSLDSDASLGTVNELCKTYDVSAITVKRALKELASAGIIKSIKSKGNFVIRQPYARFKEKTMAFVSYNTLHHVLNPMYAKVFEGAKAALSNEDVFLDFYSMPITSFKDAILSNYIMGFIVVGVRDYAFYETLVRANKNFVLIDVTSNIVPSILTNHQLGGELATEYLIKLGHTNIAIFNGNLEDETFKSRFDGYKKVLKKNNIKLRGSYVIDSLSISQDGKQNCIDKLLHLKPRPTAIFFTADEYVFDFMPVLKKMDISIPKDISIVGYNDLEGASYTKPPLTTIKQPMFEVGQRAASILLNMSDRQKLNNFKPTLIAPTLVERASCRRIKNDI